MSLRLNPFSKTRNRGKKSERGFVSPRQVEDYWNFYRRDIYIDKPGRRWPGWLLPLLAFILIVALLFWAVPVIFSRIQAFDRNRQSGSEEPPVRIYDADIWTVNRPVADVFAVDDLKSRRKSQVLYNEPVRILPDETAYGFIKVRLMDNTDGYMLLSDLTDNRDSIEPSYYLYRLVISSLSKRVMSHASRGTLVVEVMLGTVLFADFHGDGIYRVRLPDGSSGWLSDEGVIVLEQDEEIHMVPDGARFFTSTALMFNQITVLENGQSIMGVSMTGIARLAAFVNGASLPRDLLRLSQSGSPVNLRVDEDTGLVALDSFRQGDLIILGESAGDSEAADLAIYVDTGQILYARNRHTSIRLYDLTRNQDIWQRIIDARRVFP